MPYNSIHFLVYKFQFYGKIDFIEFFISIVDNDQLTDAQNRVCIFWMINVFISAIFYLECNNTNKNYQKIILF